MKLKISKSQSAVENGITILKSAIRNDLSLSEASRRNQFGRNYLSDVKARIEKNYKKKNVSRESYKNFNLLVKAYDIF